MTDLALPVDFREKIIAEIAALAGRGESCSLVGVGSSGKSNVLRHLKRADVRIEYWKQAAPRILYLYVDCNKLPQYDEFDLYTRLLELLAEAAGQAGGALAALQAPFDQAWEQSVQSASPLIAQHKLEQALVQAFAQGAEQVLVALDDCDPLILQSPAALRGLRALRDEHKYKLVYITATRLELWTIHPAHTPEFETFYELLSAHTLAVPPYEPAEAEYMLRRLVARVTPPGRPLYEDESRRIIQLSGGHAGLLKAIYSATNDGEKALAPNLMDLLARNAEVWEECGKIWDSLEEQEQTTVAMIAQGKTPAEEGLRPLRRKGLVCPAPTGGVQLFTPLFAEYALGQASESESGSAALFQEDGTLTLDPGSKRLSINGRIVGPFPFAEFETLRYIYDRRPRVCNRHELLEHLKRMEAAALTRGTLLAEFVRIMKALRQQINLPGQEYLIQTPDGGYRLCADQEL
ncbi:MAG: AAA family ATPase [Anaerolineae bacterium]